MSILKIAAIGLIGVLLASLTKTANKDLSIYVILATVSILLLYIVGEISGVFIYLETIYNNISYGREFFPIIIKVLAVAYIADFTSQLCKDAGETSIGSKIELAGKIIIFYMAMPIFTSILQLIDSLLG